MQAAIVLAGKLPSTIGLEPPLRYNSKSEKLHFAWLRERVYFDHAPRGDHVA
jgi:hypothetical protein